MPDPIIWVPAKKIAVPSIYAMATYTQATCRSLWGEIGWERVERAALCGLPRIPWSPFLTYRLSSRVSQHIGGITHCHQDCDRASPPDRKMMLDLRSTVLRSLWYYP